MRFSFRSGRGSSGHRAVPITSGIPFVKTYTEHSMTLQLRFLRCGIHLGACMALLSGAAAATGTAETVVQVPPEVLDALEQSSEQIRRRRAFLLPTCPSPPGLRSSRSTSAR
jgi:hypothetical protein